MTPGAGQPPPAGTQPPVTETARNNDGEGVNEEDGKEEAKEEGTNEETPPNQPVNLDNRPEAGDRGGNSRCPAGIG